MDSGTVRFALLQNAADPSANYACSNELKRVAGKIYNIVRIALVSSATKR